MSDWLEIANVEIRISVETGEYKNQGEHPLAKSVIFHINLILNSYAVFWAPKNSFFL